MKTLMPEYVRQAIRRMKLTERLCEIAILINFPLGIYNLTIHSYIWAMIQFALVALNCWSIQRTRRIMRELDDEW